MLARAARRTFARVFRPDVAAVRAAHGSAPEPLDEITKQAVDGELGWYSESSIMSRMARKRNRPASGLGRTRPPPSEEDFWLAAQAPGYEGEKEGNAPARKSDAEWAEANKTVAPTASLRGPAAGVWSRGGFVRVSTAAVAEGRAQDLMARYREEAAPMYNGCPGFMGGRLVLDGDGGRAVSITEWASEAAALSAAESLGYARAMGRVAECLEGTPEVVGAPVEAVAAPHSA